MTERIAAGLAAVVTGGASGFGRALAELCASNGADIAVLDIDGEGAETVAGDLAAAHGVRTTGTRVDVGSTEDVARAADLVADELGRVDLVFANVGVQQFGPIEHLTDEEWRWVLDVNVIGAARTARAFLPLLRRSSTPRLVFTTSANVLAPAARLGAYQASKYAVFAIAETLHYELADDGIAVSVVFPSGMMTRHLESSMAARPDIGGTTEWDQEVVAMMESRPMGPADITTPEDAARDVLADVLAGERYIVTHGELDEAVQERHLAISAALQRVAQRRS